MKRIPALLALAWAVTPLVSMFTGAGFGPLFFALPILAVAVLLWFPLLATRIPAFILALLVTLVFLLGSAEEGVFSTSDHTSAISIEFAIGLAGGILVCVTTLASLFLTNKISKFRSSWAGRLNFSLAAYWFVVLLADGFLSANLQTGRWLTPYLLALVFFVAGFVLRRPNPPLIASLALAALTFLTTVFFWISNASLLTMSGSWPATPSSDYFTLLPWPVILTVSLLANLALLILLARSYSRHTPPSEVSPGSGHLVSGA